MRLVFWQNIVSMIDLPYIIGASKDKRITETIVVSNDINPERKEMGWDAIIPGIERCKLYVNIDDDTIDELIRTDPENSFHMFSGLNAYPHVYRPFLMSLKYPVRRGVTSERPFTYACGCDWVKPLWMHRLRFWMRNYSIMDKIDTILEIGKDSSDYYRSLYNKWNVYSFAYCTRENNEMRIESLDPTVLQVIYVGSLSLRKSVITLLKAVRVLKEKGYEKNISISIVGDGSERKKLENYINNNNICNVFFYGNMKNQEVSKFLVNHDVLVLPSIHDGWGAVINEGLQAGLYSICSDRCGAKELFTSKDLGTSFKLGNYGQLAVILENCIKDLNNIRNCCQKRRDWAKRNISGDVIGKYLVDCLLGMEVIAPWKNVHNF